MFWLWYILLYNRKGWLKFPSNSVWTIHLSSESIFIIKYCYQLHLLWNSINILNGTYLISLKFTKCYRFSGYFQCILLVFLLRVCSLKMSSIYHMHSYSMCSFCHLLVFPNKLLDFYEWLSPLLLCQNL